MDEREFQERLGRERKIIDQIDQQLLPLFLERMQCVERVAEIKQAAGAPVLNAQREKEILDRVRQKAGALGGSAAAFFQALMSISKAREHGILEANAPLRALEREARRELPGQVGRVVCQGVRGAYSHQAARQLFGEREIEFVPEFGQVFREVEQGALGVLPVENSAAGSVTAVYDLILRYRFFIVGAVDIKVEHCLAAAGEKPVARVISHPQALSQCSEYIAAHGLSVEEYSNTAAAAEFIAKERPEGLGAICSVEAAERCGLRVIERGIQNEKNNTTRFVAIYKEAVLPEHANKISLCFSLPHTTGSLYHILQRFSVCGLNLTKIESRPIPGSRFEYDFYLDFTGSIHDPETLDLICALNAELPRFSFLGNYSESGENGSERKVGGTTMDIELKRVEAQKDIDTLCTVAEQAWHLAYDKLLAPGQVDYMVKVFQSPRAVKGQMEREGYVYYLICTNGQPGGLVGFAPRYQGRDEVFLSKLYLLPELQGSGAAGRAMALVEREARRQGLSSIRLTVNKGNTHAADVYRHYGFETVDSVVADIGGGYVMDDYIMVKRL